MSEKINGIKIDELEKDHLIILRSYYEDSITGNLTEIKKINSELNRRAGNIVIASEFGYPLYSVPPIQDQLPFPEDNLRHLPNETA